MGEASIIAIDLPKNVFQVHGAAADGSVLFRKMLSRDKLTEFIERFAVSRFCTLCQYN